MEWRKVTCLESSVHKQWAKEASTNSNRNHICQSFPCGSNLTKDACYFTEEYNISYKFNKSSFKMNEYPWSIANFIREFFYFIQNLPNIRYHILPITVYGFILWSTKSYMKNRPVLCAVYLKKRQKKCKSKFPMQEF